MSKYLDIISHEAKPLVTVATEQSTNALATGTFSWTARMIMIYVQFLLSLTNSAYSILNSQHLLVSVIGYVVFEFDSMSVVICIALLSTSLSLSNRLLSNLFLISFSVLSLMFIQRASITEITSGFLVSFAFSKANLIFSLITCGALFHVYNSNHLPQILMMRGGEK
jgi:hypothetical protein